MSPRALTPREARWVRRLRAVLADCPDTVHLLTNGDCCLSVIDAALAAGPLHDGLASARGAVLADVAVPVPVHGVSA